MCSLDIEKRAVWGHKGVVCGGLKGRQMYNKNVDICWILDVWVQGLGVGDFAEGYLGKIHSTML